ncbi:hypothetical protein, partial [Leyella stercorea]|uniref:hypothetical protein n=1 Tax=Leyella stercorea TaxID=363265 RepID=UPI002FD9C501
MLGKKAEQEQMPKEVMTRVRRWQMKVYLNVLILLFNNAGNMSRAEYKEAVKRFRQFEHGVRFGGYRRSILKGLNVYEKALTIIYFACGTCRHLHMLHNAYKRLKH